MYVILVVVVLVGVYSFVMFVFIVVECLIVLIVCYGFVVCMIFE